MSPVSAGRFFTTALPGKSSSENFNSVSIGGLLIGILFHVCDSDKAVVVELPMSIMNKTIQMASFRLL